MIQGFIVSRNHEALFRYFFTETKKTPNTSNTSNT